MQRRTTVDVNPNIAGILSLFDPALDWSADLSGDEYESVLKEFLVVNQEGSKDPRKDNSLKGDEIEAIREEWQRVRKNKNLEYKVAKRIISPQKLLNPSKLDPVKGGESGGDLVVIKEKVVSIEKILGDNFKFQEEQAKDAKKDQEDKKRKLKERLLEGAKNVWGGIQKVAGAVIKPFQNIWSKIIGFIQTVILGRVLYKILEWGANKENQKKIKSIFKFLKDWWPTLLTAYILFGTGFTRMAVGLIKSVAWGVGRLLKLIPLLKAALAKLKLGKLLSMIPGGKGKAGLLMKGGMLLGGGVLLNKAMSGDSESDTFTEDDIGSTVTPRDFDSYYSKEDKEKINQMMEEKNFNKGGPVPGSGNKDTVPAMLTPGEFVMSKGAVQQYGVDTLAGMNAAAGGTNKPTITNEYNTGGYVNRKNIINNFNSVQKFSGGGLVQPIVKEGSINSYEDAIKAGVKVEDVVVGNMRYGSINWTEKLPKGLFGFGKQRYQIMGTKWNISSVGGGAAKQMAMSTEDFVNKRMGWDGSSSSSTKVKPSKQRRGQGNKIRAVASKSGDPNLGPLSKNKPKVVVVDNPNEEVDASDTQLPTGGNRELPNINVTMHRSSKKMEVLGISI